ncbi:unnamed protein product [Protopolystoma xenopodis]|uniref:G-protein coupled receptors family 1 profile domain-containing protein n=1 Tax=Protopolystoma xenopodis TaxID=117903 RepID=A0A448XID7_9PLAT|nr:unnamed protein product [Protopolystoma xenopodis]
MPIKGPLLSNHTFNGAEIFNRFTERSYASNFGDKVDSFGNIRNSSASDASLQQFYVEIAEIKTFRVIYNWLVTFLLFFVCPFCILTLVSVKLIQAVHKSSCFMRQQCARNLVEMRCINREETRISVLLLSLIVAFFACQSPFVIYLVCSHIDWAPPIDRLYQIEALVSLALAIKSDCTFLLHIWMSQRFIKSLRRILHTVSGVINSKEVGTQGHSQPNHLLRLNYSWPRRQLSSIPILNNKKSNSSKKKCHMKVNSNDGMEPSCRHLDEIDKGPNQQTTTEMPYAESNSGGWKPSSTEEMFTNLFRPDSDTSCQQISTGRTRSELNMSQKTRSYPQEIWNENFSETRRAPNRWMTDDNMLHGKHTTSIFARLLSQTRKRRLRRRLKPGQLGSNGAPCRQSRRNFSVSASESTTTGQFLSIFMANSAPGSSPNTPSTTTTASQAGANTCNSTVALNKFHRQSKIIPQSQTSPQAGNNINSQRCCHFGCDGQRQPAYHLTPPYAVRITPPCRMFYASSLDQQISMLNRHFPSHPIKIHKGVFIGQNMEPLTTAALYWEGECHDNLYPKTVLPNAIKKHHSASALIRTGRDQIFNDVGPAIDVKSFKTTLVLSVRAAYWSQHLMT